MTAPPLVRLTRDTVSYHYDPSLAPRATVPPGATVVFETHDARAGVLLDRGPGTLFELPLPTPGKGNPLTGPLMVDGAEPGDALVVAIDQSRSTRPAGAAATHTSGHSSQGVSRGHSGGSAQQHNEVVRFSTPSHCPPAR